MHHGNIGHNHISSIWPVCCHMLRSLYLSELQCWFFRGSAFPAASIAPVERCLWDRNKRLTICGDFCVSPNVEGAVDSGLAAASKLLEALSCL